MTRHNVKAVNRQSVNLKFSRFTPVGGCILENPCYPVYVYGKCFDRFLESPGAKQTNSDFNARAKSPRYEKSQDETGDYGQFCPSVINLNFRHSGYIISLRAA